MRTRGALIAVLAGLVLAQGTYGVAHGHAFEESGAELTHVCFVCETHASEELAPAPAAHSGEFPATLVGEALGYDARPTGIAPRLWSGPRAPPTPISN